MPAGSGDIVHITQGTKDVDEILAQAKPIVIDSDVLALEVRLANGW